MEKVSKMVCEVGEGMLGGELEMHPGY